jgi:hypothetical protein
MMWRWFLLVLIFPLTACNSGMFGPSTAEAYLVRGRQVLEQGDAMCAIADFTQAIKLDLQSAHNLAKVG